MVNSKASGPGRKNASRDRRTLRETNTRSRRELLALKGGSGLPERRAALVVRVVQATLRSAALDFGGHVHGDEERGELARKLRIAVSEGLGALARVTRDSSGRLEIMRLLRDVAGNDDEALKRGVDVAEERKRFRHDRAELVRSEQLETLLALRDSQKNRRAIVSHLREFTSLRRLARIRPYASALASRLGGDETCRLIDDQSGIAFIEAALVFVPHVDPSTRKRLLACALDEQLRDGDQDSLVKLLGHLDCMRVGEVVRLFAHLFAEYATAAPHEELIHLANGEIYWMAPVIRRLGGDVAVLATAKALASTSRQAFLVGAARKRDGKLAYETTPPKRRR